MQNFMRSFSPSSSFQFVNEQLCWEQESPHRHDCHSPPHAARVGFHDDRSPPRRLAAVARSDPWRTPPAQVGFPGEATRRRRLPWVVGSDLSANNTGEGWFVSEELASGCLQLERGLVVQGIGYTVTDDNTATKTLLMGTPAKTLDQLNKVVVGFLNGSRIKGYAYDFSALKDSFDLLPQEDPLQGQGIKVEMKDLKAVFFVWDFSGNPEYHESLGADAPMHGRIIEVTFIDGEKIVGRTEGYNSQRIGFFMYPADPKGNNIRIFVVTRNTRQVRLV
jgi:hypothetical protein